MRDTVINIEEGQGIFSPIRTIRTIKRIMKEVFIATQEEDLRDSVVFAERAHREVCRFNPTSRMLSVIRYNIEDAKSVKFSISGRHERLQMALDQVNEEMIKILTNRVENSNEDPLCSVNLTIMLLNFLENQPQ